MHRLEEGRRAEASVRRLSGRGVGYWTDGKGDERVFYVTIGYQLVGLDAKTGHPLDGLRRPRRRRSQEGRRSGARSRSPARSRGTARRSSPGTSSSSAPRIAPARRRAAGPTPRATSAPTTCAPASASGSSTPSRSPAKFGNDTWLENSWSYTGNTGVWTQMTVDEELGIAYLPVEIPTGDYYGGHRPGNNLFGESLVAVDLETGKRIWHFQFVHHPIWDYDIPCAPILADITVERRTDQSGRAADQAGLGVRVRSADRRAGVADRGTAGRERRGAARVVLADAALPAQAAAVRAPGLSRVRRASTSRRSSRPKR